MKKLIKKFVQNYFLHKLNSTERRWLIDESLKNEKKIALFWCADDIIGRGQMNFKVKITEEKAYDMLQNIERHHDCCNGVTWDTLDWHIMNEIKNGK